MAALDHLDADARDERLEDYAIHVSPHAFYEWDGALDAAITEAALLVDGITELTRDEWPVHQPGPAYEAPIPGLHWYGSCEPGYPRVNPETGRCEGCGEEACVLCGRQACPDHPVGTLRVLLEPLNRIVLSMEADAA